MREPPGGYIPRARAPVRDSGKTSVIYVRKMVIMIIIKIVIKIKTAKKEKNRAKIVLVDHGKEGEEWQGDGR